MILGYIILSIVMFVGILVYFYVTNKFITIGDVIGAFVVAFFCLVILFMIICTFLIDKLDKFAWFLLRNDTMKIKLIKKGKKE